MPKLTHSITNKDDDENKKNIVQSGSLSIKKKTDKSENKEIYSAKNTDEIQKPVNIFKSESISSENDIAKWLLEFIGAGVFENLKDNQHLQLPFTDTENLSTDEWLVKALKTIFKQEQIKNIGTQILQNQEKFGKLFEQAEQIKEEKKALDKKMQKINARFENMKEEIEDTEAEKFRIEKEMQNSISLSKFITVFFKDDEQDSKNHKRLREMLLDTAEKSDKNTSEFIVKFAKGWIYVKKAISEITENEKESLETVYPATADLLREISETRIPERRPLLDIVADIISDYFKEYEFISPEQTLQIDPAIHNAEGVGSGTIKEGVTFAVIRKESRAAVKYADIRV